jgi:hypothetical protein
MSIMAILFLATGCQKEMDVLQPNTKVQTQTSAPIGKQNEFSCPVFENRQLTNQSLPARKEEHNPSDAAVEKYLYLDFDGELVSGTVWNTNGPITFPTAGYTNQQKDSVVLYVQRFLKPWNITVGRNRSTYNSTSANTRSMCIITPSSIPYLGPVNQTGAAYISSWYWASPEAPFFAFSGNFTSLYHLARCVWHELGHTVGCYHQALYGSSCDLIIEYLPVEGFGDLSWCTTMGNPYQGSICTPTIGMPYIPGNSGCQPLQNDLQNFDDAFGRRADDYCDELNQAIALSRNVSKDFVTEVYTDVDVFKTTGANPWVKVTSYNLDYTIFVYNKFGALIQTIDPEDTRGVNFKITTSGSASNSYYVKVAVSENLGFMPLATIAVGTGSIKVSAQQSL